MKFFYSKSLFTACFCLFPASLVHAAPDAELKVSLSGYYQESVSTSKDRLDADVNRTRISSKQFLELIARDSGQKIPSGSRIMVSETGSTAVVNRDGGLVLDSTKYIRARFYKKSEIIDGKRYFDDGEEDIRAYFKVALTWNLRGMKGTVRGLALETTKVSSPDRDGVQIFRVGLRSDVSGQGRIRGGTGFYEGRIDLEGRGATIR